ncbi:DUF4189 domain-containing protein [Xanthomonas campestris]|uniref:DUF4189 domain-containing protein n=1 Tax=Xanthomonas campestris TaxID=339 RepID=UPI000E329B95|nr:DUF4189 domain-containing protein [Xanthomonas campestris pv. campestris]WDJ99590.1 DUF4189 domain-containing protein [Xanthomonas campestris pv. incanae]
MHLKDYGSFAFWLLAISTILSGGLHAEGSCPPGSYPVGGQGVSGCAPIPSGSSNSGPTPTGEWRKTWGAVAMSKVGDGAIGVSSGFVSKTQAKDDALKSCERLTTKGCKIEGYYKNQCVALAQPPMGGPVVIGTGPTEDGAGEQAVGGCNKASQYCKVLFKGCSDPVFRSYR